MLRPAGLLLVFAIAACSSKNDAPVEECASCGGTKLDDCTDDSVPVLGGGCQKIGVPEGGCAEGFAHDGQGGCAAQLPAMDCAKGTFAVPGESACHEVAPCGPAPYGDLPASGTVLRVDGSYAGGSSDGSAAHPYTTIQAAIDASSEGAYIAVADGVYDGALLVTRAITIAGRCPAKVEIRATASRTIALRAKATVQGVAITGSAQGVAIDGKGAVLDRVWIHDTGASGVATFAPASGVVVKGSLIEKTKNAGLYVEGSGLRLESSAVRDVPSSVNGGNAVQAQIAKDGTPSDVVVSRSLLERAGSAGVLSYGSKATIEGSALRTLGGRKDASACVIAQVGTAAPLAPELSITGSTLEGCVGVGVRLQKGKLSFQRSVVRKTSPMSTGTLGTGIDTSNGATVAIADSLVAETLLAGIIVGAGSGSIERTVVRDVAAQKSDGKSGLGIVVVKEDAATPIVTIDACSVSRVFSVGILAAGAQVSIAHSRVAKVDAEPATAAFGDGIEASSVYRAEERKPHPAQVTVSETLVSGAARAGIDVLASTMSLERAVMHCAGIDLAVGSHYATDTMGILEGEFSLDDRGGNVCGCDAVVSCTAQSTSLDPIAFQH
jgi:hypothetical protein